MADFKILGFNHTSFTVSDVDATARFFTEALGFTATAKQSRSPEVAQLVTGVPGAAIEVVYLSGPGHSVELIEYSAPPDRGKVEARSCDTGAAHIALDTDDIEAAIAAAAAFGFKALNPPQDVNAGPNAGRKAVYTRNADGVTIEFIQPAPSAS